MTADYFRLLFDYHYWALDRVWTCIDALTPEQFVQPLDYSVGSIRNQVVHTMAAEWLWMSRIQGTSPDYFPQGEDYASAAAVRARWAEQEAEYRAYAAALTDTELERICDYRTTAGKPLSAQVGHILLHMVNHTTDHRAQILAMLHGMGAPTVEQDLIFYLRERER